MRVANLSGRAVIITDDGAIDVAEASAGEFGPTPASVFEAWHTIVAWTASAALTIEGIGAIETTLR